jgi:hypothetical protein
MNGTGPANGAPTWNGAHPAGYGDFLHAKRQTAAAVGFNVDPYSLNSRLFQWQGRIAAWAIRRGRAALFLDTGLGKGLLELVWAEQVGRHTAKPVLLVAPLAVSHQLAREALKFRIETPVTVCRSQADVQPGINITNYERLHLFDPEAFGGLSCDESSLLKGDGPLRKGVTDFARRIPFRLAATATPAPNDTQELVNHAEFLGIRSGSEILAEFFTQDGNTTHKWRLKGHAREAFWRWLSGWAVAIRKPSDLGYPDEGFLLPDLRLQHHEVLVEQLQQGQLFAAEAVTLTEQRQSRRLTLAERVARVADLANATEAPFLAWCELNDESSALAKAIRGAVEVRGSDKPEAKEKALLGFTDGSIRVLVSKPSICGFGMNWQHCNQMAFCGLGHSFEQLYQAIRRCYRFGQTEPVTVHLVTAETDGPILRNIERKQAEAGEMIAAIVRHMGDLAAGGGTEREEMEYRPAEPLRLPAWLGAR